MPESKRLNELLRDFRSNRNHLAIVIDEFGNTAGLITIEDVLEEIVGEIEDEFDERDQESGIYTLADGIQRVAGDVSIEPSTPPSAELPTEDFDTIGGLVAQQRAACRAAVRRDPAGCSYGDATRGGAVRWFRVARGPPTRPLERHRMIATHGAAVEGAGPRPGALQTLAFVLPGPVAAAAGPRPCWRLGLQQRQAGAGSLAGLGFRHRPGFRRHLVDVCHRHLHRYGDLAALRRASRPRWLALHRLPFAVPGGGDGSLEPRFRRAGSRPIFAASRLPGCWPNWRAASSSPASPGWLRATRRSTARWRRSAPWVGIYGIGAWGSGGVGAARSSPGTGALRPGRALAALALALLAAGGRRRCWARASSARPAGEISVTLLQAQRARRTRSSPCEHLPAGAGLGRRRRCTDARGELVVAPETAVPLLPEQLAELRARLLGGAARALRRAAGQAALIGVPLGDYQSGYTNSVVGLSAATRSRAPYRYDKLHLVPFGEFIPTGFRWFTELMNIPLGDFARGAAERAVLRRSRGQRIAPNICYEDLFGEELAQRFVDAGAGADDLRQRQQHRLVRRHHRGRRST